MAATAHLSPTTPRRDAHGISYVENIPSGIGERARRSQDHGRLARHHAAELLSAAFHARTQRGARRARRGGARRRNIWNCTGPGRRVRAVPGGEPRA
ncbi:MAG: hypothetical protein ACLT8E_10575 [Akkermansia sp.]